MHAVPSFPFMSHDIDAAALLDEAFRRIPQLPAGSVECIVEDATVVLRGRVATFHIKQLVQSVALGLPGLERVRNEIEVEPPGRRGWTDADV